MAQTQPIHLLLTSGWFSQFNGPYKEGHPMDMEKLVDELVEFEDTTDSSSRLQEKITDPYKLIAHPHSLVWVTSER